MNLRPEVEALGRELTDKGLLIEAGFVMLCKMAMAPDAPASQLIEMRMAFFAGAQHLFGTIMNILEPGAEPTDADLRRMDLIDAELKRFIAEFEARFLPTKGQA